MFEEYDEFLNMHKRDFHGRDSALKHYIKALSKSKVLIYHKNYSEEGTLVTFFFKTMSRFLSGGVIPSSYEKVILVRENSLLWQCLGTSPPLDAQGEDTSLPIQPLPWHWV